MHSKLSIEQRNERILNNILRLAMAVHVSKENFWQANTFSTFKERCQAIFNKELLSDVKFVIRDSKNGRESKTIPAHKFVLAISSPVLFSMFDGKLAEKKDRVEIDDCEYESFLELLRFIYSDKTNMNSGNVMKLLCLATKYMLPSLVDKCTAYVKTKLVLHGSNVFHVMSEARKYKAKGIVTHCWKVVEVEAFDAVNSDGFMEVEKSIVEELVLNQWLCIQEVDLFEAVNSWAGKECKRQSLAVTGSEKRRILGERIVKAIQFPTMTQREFADVVLDSGILTHKETNHLMKYFNSSLKFPVGFPNDKRAGQRYTMTRFRNLNRGWSSSPDHPDCLIFKVDKDVNLYAIRFFGSDYEKFSVIMKLKILRGRDLANVTGDFYSKRLRSEIGHYDGFEIAFDPPICLQPRSTYVISAKINGPPCWYGEEGLTEIGHCGVKFEFVRGEVDLMNESPTGVETGQFSQFVFTVLYG